MRGPASGEYTAPGKRAVRQLLLDLGLATDVRTFATFWGHGVDSRMFAPHFDVIACEVTEAKHETMTTDGLANGYRVHRGRGGSLRESVDMFHADFDGTVSQSNFDEVGRIAQRTNRWLAVTLSNDHKLDPWVQGRAAFHTIPAWLTGASGFTLEYLTRYRSTGGQTMWFALLQRRTGKGTAHQVLPVQISYSIGERGYWASRRLYETRLLPHRYSPRNEKEKAADRQRYLASRAVLDERLCASCGVPFAPTHGRQRHCTMSCRTTTYRKAWYAQNSDRQKANVAAWRLRRRSIVARPAEPSGSREAA